MGICFYWEIYLMESQEITSSDRQGFIPVHMVLICFRLDPSMSRGRGEDTRCVP